MDMNQLYFGLTMMMYFLGTIQIVRVLYSTLPESKLVDGNLQSPPSWQVGTIFLLSLVIISGALLATITVGGDLLDHYLDCAKTLNQ